MDRQTVTDDERSRARRLERATFEEPESSNPEDEPSLSPSAAPAPAAAFVGDGRAHARALARALAPIRDRVLEKRILLRPHWAESDRRRRGFVSEDLFKAALDVYGLWPDHAKDASALVRAYAAHPDGQTLIRTGALRGRVDYLRFCKDVEPRGHRGRDPQTGRADPDLARHFKTTTHAVYTLARMSFVDARAAAERFFGLREGTSARSSKPRPTKKRRPRSRCASRWPRREPRASGGG